MKPTVEEFFESTKGIRGNDLLKYWGKLSSKWSESEKLEFALELAEHNVWYWDTILDDIICSEEPKDGYPLLAKIVEKEGVGLKLHKFRSRCQKDLSFSREYVKLLDQENTRNTAMFSGLLLALSFQGTAIDWSEIESRLSSVNENRILSAAFAIRVLDNNNQTDNIPTTLSEKIFNRILDNRNADIRRQLVWFLISHFDPAVEQISRCLDSILHDREVLGTALIALSSKNPVPKDTRFHILEKAASLQDQYLEQMIGDCLASWGTNDVSRSLEIIKNIAIMRHHIPGALTWAAERISQKMVDEAFDVVESWLTENISEGQRIIRNTFLYPHLLIILTKEHRDKLIERLNKLSQEERNDRLVISTIREYMKSLNRGKDWSPVDEQDDVYLQSCVGYLKTIAQRKGKAVSKFPSSAEPKIFQCGRMIELIEEVEFEPDPKLVRAALDNYPNINRFIKVSVDKEELESPPPTPFFILLGLERCKYQEYLKRIDEARITLKGGKLQVAEWRADDALMRQSLLEHLDNCLARVDKTESGTGELRKKLLHQDVEQFRSALSEIDVIGRLRRKLKVDISELSEVITGDGTRLPKRPDISVQLDSESIRIEVITPQMAAILRFLGGGGIPNRLTGRIISEFHKHFRGQTEDKDAMIIADTNWSEIDYWSVISSMQGTPSLQVLIDKSSGGVVAERQISAQDTVTDREPQTESILGVLAFKRRMSKEGHLLLIGKFFPNIHSRAPDKLIFCRLIEEHLLDKVETVL